MSSDFDAMLAEDLKGRVARYVKDFGMSPEAAMQKASAELLSQNPFVPPTHGCPVNDLPPELLALIFQLGCKMAEEEEAEEDDADYSDDALDLQDEWETDDEAGDVDEEVDGDALEAEDVRMGSPVKRAVPPSPGARMAPEESDTEDEDEAHGDEEEEEGPEQVLDFQVLVSHVCRHWREIALGEHTLWTTLRFETHLNVEKAQAWLQRAGGLPLDIFIDCTTSHPAEHDHDHEDEDETQPMPGAYHHHAVLPSALSPDIHIQIDQMFDTVITSMGSNPSQEPEPLESCISLDDIIVIMDLIIPHVHEWRIFEVSVNQYKYAYEILSRIAGCAAAPLLEEFGLYNYEETEEAETFEPAELATAFLPFHGDVPKLTVVAFWGVHVAWEESLSFLRGLREIELAYHTKDVRPSFETFRTILDNSPELEVLTLCASGPTGDIEAIAMPQLRALVLCYLELDYVKPLLGSFELPRLEDLTLELDEEDYTEFVRQLAGHARGQTRSLLAGLTTLKLTSLPCDDTTTDALMAQLENLKRLDVNCVGEEVRFFERLLLVGTAGKAPVYCPKLDSLRVTGVEGKELRKLVSTRKAAGAPLINVFVGKRDYVSTKDEQWLRDNLQNLEFFEPSDEEDMDMVEVDDDDIEVD